MILNRAFNPPHTSNKPPAYKQQTPRRKLGAKEAHKRGIGARAGAGPPLGGGRPLALRRRLAPWMGPTPNFVRVDLSGFIRRNQDRDGSRLDISNTG
jgi:hypothetical protein